MELDLSLYGGPKSGNYVYKEHINLNSNNCDNLIDNPSDTITKLG